MTERTFILLLSLIICLGFNSCTVDKTTRYTAMLYNNSSIPIIILPFKSGIVHSSDTINLGVGDSFQIANGWQYGDVSYRFFESEYLAIEENDSIKVLFNSILPVYHFVSPPSIEPEKYHAFNSERNIINRKNYEFIRVKEKNTYINIHRYYFTESDYEYARE